MTAICTTWQGRRGSVLLGPTQARVARYLADLTRHGLVTIRTQQIADACHLERSEAYRITRRLRVLGLFGIANDPAGARGGRRIWRTSIEHVGNGLDAGRHRTAWARMRAWAVARRRRLADRLATLHAPAGHHLRRTGLTARPAAQPVPPAGTRAAGRYPAAPGPPASPRAGGPSFAERLAPYAAGWLARALEDWTQ